MVFERFADGARQAVVASQEFARLGGHEYIDTTDLLLGTLTDAGVAAVLGEKGITPLAIQMARSRRRKVKHVPFAEDTKRAIQAAVARTTEVVQVADLVLGIESAGGSGAALLHNPGLGHDDLVALLYPEGRSSSLRLVEVEDGRAPRSFVLVSGAPGSGKTTLAVPLAAALGFPLLSKDLIKERLHDSLVNRDNDELAWSKQLGSASMELIWTLASGFPQAVLEANFRPHSPHERSRISALGGRVVEVYCSCPPKLAKARYAARARTLDHHPTHVLSTLSDELLAEYDGPIGIGNLLVVDTTTDPDIESIGASVASLLQDR